jgi:hypothetical protein
MAEQADYELRALTPEEQVAADCIWPQVYEYLADKEEQISPDVEDTTEEFGFSIDPNHQAESGYIHMASAVAKQLGSVALYPGKAYWNVLKWGINHVR